MVVFYLSFWEKYQQPQICRWYHFNVRKWRETKELLDEGERGEWKSWFEMQYQKTKIMASCPITSWQIEGKKWKQWQRLFSWAPKSLWTMITAWELDHKEGWAPKNWWFWTVVLEKTLESPLNFKEIKLVNPEGRNIEGRNPEYSLEGLMLKLKL